MATVQYSCPLMQYERTSEQMVAAKRGAIRRELKNGLPTGRRGTPLITSNRYVMCTVYLEPCALVQFYLTYPSCKFFNI